MSSVSGENSMALTPTSRIRGMALRAPRWLGQNRLIGTGLCLVLALIAFSYIGKEFVPYKSTLMGAAPTSLAPSGHHILGTDGYGRDILALLVFGIPNTLAIGLLAGLVGLGVGAILGLIAGYYRTFLDTVVRSFADVMLVIPALAILIMIAALVRVVTVEMMALIVGLLSWAVPARVVRAQTLTVRERMFVEVARLSGKGDIEIIFLEILPNLLGYLAAAFVGAVSTGILAAVGLQVLGLGPQTTPTVGMVLYYAFNGSAIFRGMWWWWGLPVAVLAIIFTSLFLLSLGIDRYVNPRLGLGETTR